MNFSNILAGKAATVLVGAAVVGGVYWYVSNRVKGAAETAKNIASTTNKAVGDFTPAGIVTAGIDSIFSGIRAIGGDTASSGGIVNTDTKTEKEDYWFKPTFDPVGAALYTSEWLFRYFRPTEQEGNQTTSGVPLLLQKPIVFPKESQDIVDKTLEDSWFTYTSKPANK